MRAAARSSGSLRSLSLSQSGRLSEDEYRNLTKVQTKPSLIYLTLIIFRSSVHLTFLDIFPHGCRHFPSSHAFSLSVPYGCMHE